MNKEEMLRKLKGIHLLYSMPQLAQNMMPEHFAIVEYEKLAYEQQAIIDQLINNRDELEEWVKEQRDYYDRNDQYSNFRAYADELDDVLWKMKEIKEKNNGN